jgi:tRNA threonylcarbamoyl adenosine modification protein (Sua5/YciO/YrdC/YwlC family)
LSPSLIKVRKGRPDKEALREARIALGREDLVLYPSDTVYGILCLARSERAVGRLQMLKGYVVPRPFILLVDSLEMAQELSPGMTGDAVDLAKKHWPGPLTLVLAAGDEVPSSVRSERREVALRYPDDYLATSLIAALKAPLVSTSANRRDERSPLSVQEVPNRIREQCSVVLDGGKLPETEPSTIARVAESGIQVLRQGSLRLD